MIDYNQALLAAVTPADKMMVEGIDSLAIVLVEINKHVDSQFFFITYRDIMVFCDECYRYRQIL